MLFSRDMCLSNIRTQIPQRIKHRHIYIAPHQQPSSTVFWEGGVDIVRSNVLGRDCWSVILRASWRHVSRNRGFVVYRYSVSWIYHVLLRLLTLPPGDELDLQEGRLENKVSGNGECQG